MNDITTAGQTEILASPPGTEHNTFTIIGRCERTGMLGICTTTRSLSVGSRVTHGRARVGIIAFQAVADPRMGYLAMRLFDLGYSAPKVVRELQDSDPHAEMRQIAAIDGDGSIGGVTGPKTRPWTGHQARKHHVAMGNVLTSERTVTSMTERFEATAAMPLEDRLMLAIEAGRDAGRQVGGQVSAALLVFGHPAVPARRSAGGRARRAGGRAAPRLRGLPALHSVLQPARVQSRDPSAVRLARRAAGQGERGAVAARAQARPRRLVIVTKTISAASPMSRSPVPVR